MVYKLV
jgi:nicotinate phosphoribosyltransferase